MCNIQSALSFTFRGLCPQQLPLSTWLLEHFCHLENQEYDKVEVEKMEVKKVEVEKVEVEGRRGRGEGEDRGGEEGEGEIESPDRSLTWLTNCSIFS